MTESGRDGTLIVLVHGVLDRARSFRHVEEILVTEYRTVSYDRRGYGRAIDAPGAPVGIDRHIEDLVTILDGRHAIVVGHSFGGVTALGAAARAPELVDAVVVYETVLAWAPGWDDTVMQEMLRTDDPEAAGLRLMLGARYDTLTDDRRSARRREASAFVAEERSVRTGAPPFDLTSIRAPLVYGASNPRMISPVVDHLRGAVPQIAVVTIPDAGHHAHRTEPEAFAGLVRRAAELAGE